MSEHLTSQLAEPVRTRLIEIEHDELGQEFILEDGQQLVRIRAAIGPRVEFAEHDGGNVQISAMLDEAVNESAGTLEMV